MPTDCTALLSPHLSNEITNNNINFTLSRQADESNALPFSLRRVLYRWASLPNPPLSSRTEGKNNTLNLNNLQNIYKNWGSTLKTSPILPNKGGRLKKTRIYLIAKRLTLVILWWGFSWWCHHTCCKHCLLCPAPTCCWFYMLLRYRQLPCSNRTHRPIWEFCLHRLKFSAFLLP